MFFTTYCKGAATPLTCGVESLDLIAGGSTNTVTVSKLPYYTVASNSKNYLGCYYHIAGETNIWKNGAKINVTLVSATDVSVYMYGGNNRSNASISVTSNNVTLSLNITYSIDISADAMLLVLPNSGKFTTTQY